MWEEDGLSGCRRSCRVTGTRHLHGVSAGDGFCGSFGLFVMVGWRKVCMLNYPSTSSVCCVSDLCMGTSSTIRVD